MVQEGGGPLGHGSHSAGTRRPSTPAATISGALLNCAADILGATRTAAALFLRSLMLIQGRLLLSQVQKLRGSERDRWGGAHLEAPPCTRLDQAPRSGGRVLPARDTQSKALCPLWDDILSNYNAFHPLLMAIFVDKVQLGNYTRR